jgi:hypothetical protein
LPSLFPQHSYCLQFNGVKDFKISVQGEPWLQVHSHAAFSSSEYLTEALATADPTTHDEGLLHFEILCGKGRFDIIAKSFTFSEFNEISYVSDPARPVL